MGAVRSLLGAARATGRAKGLGHEYWDRLRAGAQAGCTRVCGCRSADDRHAGRHASRGSAALAQAPPAQPAPQRLPKAQPKAPAQQPPAQTQAQPPGAGDARNAAVDFHALDQGLPEGARTPMRSRSASPAREGRIDTGMLVIGAVLDRAPTVARTRFFGSPCRSECKSRRSTRAIVDQGQPMTAPYMICFPNGCTGRLRGQRRADRQAEERAEPGGARHQQPGAKPSACRCRCPILPRPMTDRRPIRRFWRSGRRRCRTSLQKKQQQQQQQQPAPK